MEMDGRSSDGGETRGRRLGVAARWAGVAADGGRVTRRGLRADRGHSGGSPAAQRVCAASGDEPESAREGISDL
jgi:hypothetical protein